MAVPYLAPDNSLIQPTWRAAVLRGWSSATCLPLVTVASIAWDEPSTIAKLKVRWLPVMTDEEASAQNTWFRFLTNADPTLDVTDFLTHHAYSPSVDVVEVAVPDGARTLGGVADLVLDEALAEPWFEQLSGLWEPQVKSILMLDAAGKPHG